MAFASIQTMDGDPQELLRLKSEVMDPVVDELAPAFGALLSITGSTDRGIVVVYVWESPRRAEELSRHPAVAAAQARSGLPALASIQPLRNVSVKDYLGP